MFLVFISRQSIILNNGVFARKFLDRINYALAAAVLVILLTACGVMLPKVEQAESPVSELPDEAVLRLPPRVDVQEESVSAVDQLLAGAAVAMSEHRFDQASALVERAMRVAPKDSRSYFALAQIRYKQNQLGQVEMLIRKAKSLSTHDEVLLDSIERFSNSMTKLN